MMRAAFVGTIIFAGQIFEALSLSQPSKIEKIIPRPYIQLTNPIDTSEEKQKDRLPASFVINSWPVWVLDEKGTLSRIPDDKDSADFISPTSIDELWQAVDLRYPELSFALGLHIRQGVIRHIMPAIDLSFGGEHRNRGLCTVPIAHSWIDYTLGLERWVLTQATKKLEEKEWTDLGQSDEIGGAIERAVRFLSDAPPDALGEGSHIVNVILGDSSFGGEMFCPKVGQELRVVLGSAEEETSSNGVLQVYIQASMAGSESEYLPEAYKPLYQDESLRRPEYAEFKKRTKAAEN